MTITKIAGMKVSFIVEWANTTYNGLPRFFGFLDILKRQWTEMNSADFPVDLDDASRELLQKIHPVAELLIVSGETISSALVGEIERYCQPVFTPAVHVSSGLEYYALKNYGAGLASGDLLCFLDSDIYPDPGWLHYLLGSFAQDQIGAVAGVPYVAPIDLFSRAFALGWTYPLPEKPGGLSIPTKFYANNLVLRAEVFCQAGFPELQRRTRGAGSLLGERLARLGYPVWLNSKALVDHPAPSGWQHLAVRALAHGRDRYMKYSEERNWEGLIHSQEIAGSRLLRALKNTSTHWRRVGLGRLEVIPATAIMLCYYTLFSLGGLLTHLSPKIMGRHFRL